MKALNLLAWVLFVISLVSAMKKPKVDVNGGANLSAQKRILGLFGDQYEIQEGDTVEKRFEKLTNLVSKQEQLLVESSEEMSNSQQTFDKVCKKERMSSVTSWADGFFAQYFLGSTAHSLATSQELYIALKDHVDSLTAYKAELDMYTADLFAKFSNLFYVVRQQNMILFFNVICGFKIKYKPFKLPTEERAVTFASLIKSSAYDIKLLFDTSSSFFAELDVVYARMVKDKVTELGIAWIGTAKDTEKEHLAAIYDVAQLTCTAIINTVYLALGHKTMDSVEKKLLMGPNAPKDGKVPAGTANAQMFVESFFNNFYRIFFKYLNDDGSVATDKPDWKPYLQQCVDEADQKFKNQQELLILIKLNVKVEIVFAVNYRVFFSQHLYRMIKPDTWGWKSFRFDQLILFGLGNEPMTYRQLAAYRPFTYKFHYNFFADFMKIGVEGNTKFPVVANERFHYTFLYTKSAFKTSQVALEKSQYAEATNWVYVLESIYRIYSFLRETDAKLNIDNGAEPKVIYQILYEFLVVPSNIELLLNAPTPFIRKEVLMRYWASIVSYCCYKHKPDGSCSMTEPDFNQMVDKHGFVIQVLVTRMTLITILETLWKKRLDEAWKKVIFEQLDKIGMHEAIPVCNGKYTLACVTEARFTLWLTFVNTYLVNTPPNDKNVLFTFNLVFMWLDLRISEKPEIADIKKVIDFLWAYLVFKIRAEKRKDIHEVVIRYLTQVFASRVTSLNDAKKGLSLLEIIHRVSVLTEVSGGARKYLLNYAPFDTNQVRFNLAILYWVCFIPRYREWTANGQQNGPEKTMLEDRISQIIKYYVSSFPTEMTALGITDKLTWNTYFSTAATKLDTWDFLELALRAEQMLSVMTFFETFSIVSAKLDTTVKSFYTEKYQNPLLILLNFLNLAYSTSQSFYGNPDEFYHAVWAKLEFCIDRNLDLVVDKIDANDPCQWSYRKYAELYFMVKYDYGVVGENLVGKVFSEYHPKGKVLAHQRIFQALVYGNSDLFAAIKSVCEKEAQTNFCITWSILGVIYPNVKSIASKPMTPPELYNAMAIVMGMTSSQTPITVENRFNLLAVTDALDYFLNGRSMNFDRFVSWIDPHDVEKSKIELFVNGGLALRNSKVWNLPVSDTKGKEYLLMYLRMNYFKNTYSQTEYFSHVAAAASLIKEELFQKIISFANIPNFFAIKYMLIFSRKEAEFQKISSIIIDKDRFLVLPKINNRAKDIFVDLVIEFVACDDIGEDANSFGTYRYSKGSLEGSCKTKSKYPAEKGANVYVARMNKIMELIFGGFAINTVADTQSRFGQSKDEKVAEINNYINYDNTLKEGSQQALKKEVVENQATLELIKKVATDQLYKDVLIADQKIIEGSSTLTSSQRYEEVKIRVTEERVQQVRYPVNNDGPTDTTQSRAMIEAGIRQQLGNDIKIEWVNGEARVTKYTKEELKLGIQTDISSSRQSMYTSQQIVSFSSQTVTIANDKIMTNLANDIERRAVRRVRV